MLHSVVCFYELKYLRFFAFLTCHYSYAHVDAREAEISRVQI